MAILIRKKQNSASMVRTGRGGRKKKNEEQQLNQTVKTTLTKTDLEGLQQQYRQNTVGQKISFAEYIRQRLLATADSGKGEGDRLNLLSIQLELAQIERQLIQILEETRQQNGVFLVKEQDVLVAEGQQKADDIQLRMEQNLDQIEATIKQISQWLYDCSPEKI